MILNKLLKNIIFPLFALIVVVVFFIFVAYLPNEKRLSLDKQRVELQKQSEELQQLRDKEQEMLAKKKAEAERLDETSIKQLVGNSMKQYGISTGEYTFYINRECNIGDMCAFLCFADKCVNSQTGHELFFKKLIKKENNCYWFEGNPKSWNEDGVEFQSWDSRKYGWLCHGEIYIQGVLKSKDQYIEGVSESPTTDLTKAYKCEDANYPDTSVLESQKTDQEKFKIGDKITLSSGKSFVVKEVEVGNFYKDGSTNPTLMKAQVTIKIESDGGALNKEDYCKMYIIKGDEIIKLTNSRGADSGQFTFETQKTNNFDGMELNFGNEATIILDPYIKANEL